MDGRFDDMLLGLAQKHRGIDDLLYSIFSFYERRTDLFHVKSDPEEKKGFLPGKAEEALRDQFHHFQARYLERAQPHLLAPSGSSKRSAKAAAAPAAPTGPIIEELPEGENAADAAGGGDTAGGGDGASASAAVALPKDIPDGVNASPLEGGDPGAWAKSQPGGEHCSWSQTVQEVNLEINVEKCTSRDIMVKIESRKVCVKRKGEVLLEGQLADKINCEESTWHLDDGKQVVISLEKIKSTFWQSLFEGGTGPQGR